MSWETGKISRTETVNGFREINCQAYFSKQENEYGCRKKISAFITSLCDKVFN